MKEPHKETKLTTAPAKEVKTQSHISREGGQPSRSPDLIDERYPFDSNYDSATSPNAQNMRQTHPDIPLMSDNVRVNLHTDPLSSLDDANDPASCTGAEFGGYGRYSNGYTGHPGEVKSKNAKDARLNANAAAPASVTGSPNLSVKEAEKERRHHVTGIYLALAVTAAAVGAIGWLTGEELMLSNDGGNGSPSSSITAENSASTPDEAQVGAAKEGIPKTENFVITYEASSDTAETAEPAETETAELPSEDVSSEMIEASAAEVTAEPDTAPVGSASVSTPMTPSSFILPVADGVVDEPFSGGELVKSKTLGEWRTHDGLDIAAPEGSDVLSIADGLVESVTNDSRWGHTVTVNYGDYTAYYYNLGEQIDVQVGESIAAGQPLGEIGNSSMIESAEPPHLHLGIKKEGSWIDPALLLGLDDGDPAAE